MDLDHSQIMMDWLFGNDVPADLSKEEQHGGALALEWLREKLHSGVPDDWKSH